MCQMGQMWPTAHLKKGLNEGFAVPHELEVDLNHYYCRLICQSLSTFYNLIKLTLPLGVVFHLNSGIIFPTLGLVAAVIPTISSRDH